MTNRVPFFSTAPTAPNQPTFVEELNTFYESMRAEIINNPVTPENIDTYAQRMFAFLHTMYTRYGTTADFKDFMERALDNMDVILAQQP